MEYFALNYVESDDKLGLCDGGVSISILLVKYQKLS